MAFMTSNRIAKKHPQRSSFDDQGEYMHDYEENDNCEFQGYDTPTHFCSGCQVEFECQDFDHHGCSCTPEDADCGHCVAPQFPFITQNLFADGQPMAAPEESEEFEIEPLDDTPSFLHDSKSFRRICILCDGNCECEIEEEPQFKQHSNCLDCGALDIWCRCDPNLDVVLKDPIVCTFCGTEWAEWLFVPNPNHCDCASRKEMFDEIEASWELDTLSVQANFSPDDFPTPTPMAADKPSCNCLFGEECNSCAPRMSFPCLSCTIPIFCSAPMVCSDCVSDNICSTCKMSKDSFLHYKGTCGAICFPEVCPCYTLFDSAESFAMHAQTCIAYQDSIADDNLSQRRFHTCMYCDKTHFCENWEYERCAGCECDVYVCCNECA